ncbi:Uma2 family endonuclease [Aquisphaera insulae]|uniref:Uma2 family endonuclease n=1 Tax=Aquisphaera insulae TaxID=2712864 RepID=UPI0013ECC7DB|nr:Uma2 family endonuclease [Aquisphaera insulae]
MSTIEIPKRILNVEYPESDGEPMAENTEQYKWIVVIKEGLEFLFRDRADVFIAADLFWYAEEGYPWTRLAPDILVAFGRPKGRRGSYLQWEEEGIAPQVIFEIHSPGNRPAIIMKKFRFYERHGVEEYYYFDPEDGELTGWVRNNGSLEEVREMNGFVSPRLAIRFDRVDGPEWLRIIGPDGRRFRTPLEVAESEIAAQQRADAEQQRADAAQQRAERLAARLRELGEALD